LLDFARQDLPHATPFDLNDVIREQLALIEGVIPPGIRVQIELDPMLDPIRGDARALGSAFVHLCFNALDAMPERGVLTLRTRRLGAAEVELDVDDTGFGMPKAILDKAFEPFFTTKQRGKGTGLGLPVVYGAVKAHQGRVEIHSEPGRGTQVQIVLPVCPDVLDEAESIPEGASSKKRHGLHILLVDDDELVQTAVSSQLRHLGHSVTIAPHGQAALDSLNSGLSVDLVLLDLDMPVLDGRAALPRLRALRPTLPVIIETGKLDDHAEDLAREHPDVSILIKPFSLNELHAAIVPWVKQEAPGAE
jgi:CheY-like chemotaxis protein